MTKYYVDQDNNYLGGFDGAVPPEDSIEVPVPNHGFDTWDGTQWQPYIEPAKDTRQRAYISELSSEGTFDRTIGDCIDALIKAVALGDKTDLNKLLLKIQDIKARYPDK